MPENRYDSKVAAGESGVCSSCGSLLDPPHVCKGGVCMARGDILLYRSDGSLPTRIIAFATHGPFVHAEVDLGDGTSIGSLSRGISHYVPTKSSLARAISVPIHATDPDHVEAGIAWLEKQVGHQYGWVDIFDQAVLYLKLPKLFFFVPGSYDCSDLVSRYLDVVGSSVLGTLGDTPDLVSPNDIARAFGVLKEG